MALLLIKAKQFDQLKNQDEVCTNENSYVLTKLNYDFIFNRDNYCMNLYYFFGPDYELNKK